MGTATGVGSIGADLARRKGAIMTSLGSDEPYFNACAENDLVATSPTGGINKIVLISLASP